MNLALDIGNTRTKVALFEEDHVVMSLTLSTLDYESLSPLFDTYPIETVVASVVGKEPSWVSLLPKDVDLVTIDATTPLPFAIDYASPSTLGCDRIAVVAGALALGCKPPLLVVDAGSCITLDYLDADYKYQGGAILPGLQMKLRALHTFTARLPLINVDELDDCPLLGRDTQGCIAAGTLKATALALDAFVEQYQQLSDLPLSVVITGGDGCRLHQLLTQQVLHEPMLLMKGLNQILKNNEKKHHN